MLRHKSKKGALELSINAIVILVIAIVVLGLALGMIRVWFTKAGSQVAGLLDVKDIKDRADANTPLKMAQTVSVKTGDTGDVQISFYNKGLSEITNAKPVLNSCTSVAKNQDLLPAEMPVLVAVATPKVSPSSDQGFATVINAKTSANVNVPAGQYLCTITVDPETTTFSLVVTP